ncbi:thermonuclease family protein [Corynebacterium sp. UBA2622]|uniref:thermonuclease family protein n=1 Tax=Corynebacterium sp. UBA2622 TaxID=1946393 RepID=UPI0025B7E806|nr:thermonuclease family protein [Corynebacterium sp. UBA2622]
MVEKIIDGDTIDVSLGGETTRVRFLNVDAPEIGRNGSLSECFAEQARDRVQELIPVGSEISLKFDQERLDRYGRTLAGVFRDGALINAEIAREGFGVAMDIAPNHRFYKEVSDAEGEAARAGRGISAAGPECYVAPEDAASVKEAQAAVAAAGEFAPAAVHVGSEAEFSEARTILGRLAAAEIALSKIDHDREHWSEFRQEAYGKEIERSLRALHQDLSTHRDRFDAAIRNEEQRREQNARTESLPQMGAWAREIRKSLEAEGPAPSAAAGNGSVPPVAPSPSPSGGGAKYTGCRAYGGKHALTSVDENGRPYAKIDCAAKAPIG